jgi:hypothetical protein
LAISAPSLRDGQQWRVRGRASRASFRSEGIATDKRPSEAKALKPWEADGLFDGSGLSLAEARETPAAGAETLWMEKIAQPAPAAS